MYFNKESEKERWKTLKKRKLYLFLTKHDILLSCFVRKARIKVDTASH